ncbi:MAG: cation:proton antiporter [Alphaproteobacteria bacterium]
MPEILTSVLAVAALLVAVSVAVPVAARLRIPHSVLLAALGIVLGLVVMVRQDGGGVMVGDDLVRGFGDLGISAPAFLAIFLPPLLFAAGLNLDVRRLFDEIAAVLLLAVVAVVVCTGVVGFVLGWVSPLGLVPCLLLGAIIATTDPAAVVAIFRDLGAPRRLGVLVEGESIFNDAAAIALFSILLAFVTGTAAPSFAAGAMAFVTGFAGGIAVGFVLARLICGLLPRMGGALTAETTLTVALAYLSYVVAELYFHVSGVVAVATAAVVMASYGPLRLSPPSWRSLLQSWSKIEFWATSLIFILASMVAARVLSEVSLADIGVIVLLAVAAMVARALVLWGLLPGLTALKLVQPVSGRYKVVILWGGLRGAVTMVLAIAISENMAVPPEIRRFVAVAAIGFVLMTLFVNAPTLGPLLRLLRLDRLDPVEAVLRDRVMALSLVGVREQVAEVARHYGLDGGLVDRVVPAPARPAEPAPKDAKPAASGSEESRPADRELTVDVRVQVGLLTLVTREREAYLAHFEQQTISRRLVAVLVAGADALADRVKVEGIEGYGTAGAAIVRMGRRLRLSLWLHRRLGWSRLLASALADRFEMLLIQRLVLREARHFNERSIRPVLGGDASDVIAARLAERMEAVQRALAALELQYPVYASALGVQHLARAALRFEEHQYQMKREEALISREVYENLQADLRARRAAIRNRPSLDLGFKLAEMVRRVPMFAKLTETQLERLVRELKPVLATPGERIVVRGERGEAMYMVAAGSVEVRLPSGPVRLGTGDVFGEMALVLAQPRSADVVSVGYSQLLCLDGRGFRRFVRGIPALAAEIEAIARRRNQSNLVEAAGSAD